MYLENVKEMIEGKNITVGYTFGKYVIHNVVVEDNNTGYAFSNPQKDALVTINNMYSFIVVDNAITVKDWEGGFLFLIVVGD